MKRLKNVFYISLIILIVSFFIPWFGLQLKFSGIPLPSIGFSGFDITNLSGSVSEKLSPYSKFISANEYDFGDNLLLLKLCFIIPIASIITIFQGMRKRNVKILARVTTLLALLCLAITVYKIKDLMDYLYLGLGFYLTAFFSIVLLIISFIIKSSYGTEISMRASHTRVFKNRTLS